MKLIILLISVQLLLFASTFAQVKVVRKNCSLVDSNALTVNGRFSSVINGRAFQKDPIVSHKGYQYLAYYNDERYVCLSRRKLDGGQWETIKFTDYYFESNDSHNVISMGICPNDGTIHLAFDHHVHSLHYRVSKKGLANHPDMGWDPSLFSPILSELEEGKPIKLTYPKFWPTPEGNLQFCYRIRGSGNGDRLLVDYDAETGSWENTRKIDSGNGYFEDVIGVSETRCSYPNGYDYDAKNVLHATWVWREDGQGANHDLIYVYSEDNGFTWKNNEGELLESIPQINSPGIVVQQIPRVFGLGNDHGQVVDNCGRVHVVMHHATEKSIIEAGSMPGETRWGPRESQRYHHYWRDINGKWSHFELPLKVGDRPKIFADNNDNLVMIYGGEGKIGRLSEESEKGLLVAIATSKNKWNDWHIAHIEKGSFNNEMLGDVNRWKTDGILSIMVQDRPSEKSKPSALKVVDLLIQIEE